MKDSIFGKTNTIGRDNILHLSKLTKRKISKDEFISPSLASQLSYLANKLNRKIGLLVNRKGDILKVLLGEKNILYLPYFEKKRSSKLSTIGLIYADPITIKETSVFPDDIITDLHLLRLDYVIKVKQDKSGLCFNLGHLLPQGLFKNQGNSFTTSVHHNLTSLNNIEKTSFLEALDEQFEKLSPKIATLKKPSALLIRVSKESKEQAERSLSELASLATTAGIKVVGSVFQNKHPNTTTLLGKGKLEEIIIKAMGLGANMLLFDTELKPSQWRIITNITDLLVLDRTMLILDIFATRASSNEGKIQVELAQLRYNLPKLVEKDAGLSRLTGGIGGRGPGETKLEIGRRRIRERIARLEKQIKKINKRQQAQHLYREKNKIPLVALLGYTNVGKSTLFNALTKANVTAENKLFATLDPTQRLIKLHNNNSNASLSSFVLSDTVGFVKNMPKHLREAFKATIEHLYRANLFLHLIDISDPYYLEKYKESFQLLKELNLADKPTINVLTKIDQSDKNQLKLATNTFQRCIAVSSITREGIKELLFKILQFIS